jgi:hypothetical protein
VCYDFTVRRIVPTHRAISSAGGSHIYELVAGRNVGRQDLTAPESQTRFPVVVDTELMLPTNEFALIWTNDLRLFNCGSRKNSQRLLISEQISLTLLQ